MTQTYPFPWQFDPARYSDMYLMGQVTETQVQKSIVSFLRALLVDVVPIDAGGRRQRGRMIGAAKAAGVNLAGVQHAKTGAAIPAGFADLEATLAPNGRALYIEVKAPAWRDVDGTVIRSCGSPSGDQLRFLLAKHKRGALVLVAWSSEDVEKFCFADLDRNLRALR